MDTLEEKKRILNVDDEVSFARMVKLNLEKTGAFDVRTENKATYALAAAREFKRDLQLRDTPIIFLTATVSKREAGEGGLNSGGALFLAKPVSVETLVARINEHLPPPQPPPEPAPQP